MFNGICSLSLLFIMNSQSSLFFQAIEKTYSGVSPTFLNYVEDEP